MSTTVSARRIHPLTDPTGEAWSGIDLPTGFSFGTATSSHQVEGAVAEDGRTPSIWDTFSHTDGNVDRGETADVAADHYHRFAEDVALMRDLGVDTYRFSLSWSRLLPEGDGELNDPGVAFYRSLVGALHDAGITPVVCLYHWDLPQVLQDRGGWASAASPAWFEHYARRAKEALGDLVTEWMTLNEPYCAAFLGHGSGVHAPGITDPRTAWLAAHHQMLAHHRAVRVMRATNPRAEDRYSIALNLVPAQGREPDGPDGDRAAEVDLIQSAQFLDAVLDGTYPDRVREWHARYGVADACDPAAFAEVLEPIDWLGVNYYNIIHVHHEDGAPSPDTYPGADQTVFDTPPGPLTDMGWGIEPHGLAGQLRRVRDRAPGLPMVVTENGAAFPDEVGEDGEVHDPDRVDYLNQHLRAVSEAIDDGCEVVGYHVWSLLDNFEWALGYAMRFGIIRVEPETLERIPKDSARWYAGLINRTRA